jgi:paraquat-inducible protein B
VSATTHPRAVGAFVLLAIGLVIAAVVLLSSRGWFQERDRYSVYFPGSIRGLNPGAPVTFRGIKVGQVAEVNALLTGKPEEPIQIEVVIELLGNVVKAPEGVQGFTEGQSAQQRAQELIERGIRGRLMSQSLLTGQKYIDFDFQPDEPARFSGLHPRYPELPTTPTAMEKLGDKVEALMNKLAELPLDQMLDNLQRTLASARKLLESPDLQGALAGARSGAAEIAPTLKEARAALADARKLVDTLGGEVKDTASEARETTRKARETLDRAQQAIDSMDTTLRGADDARVRASRSLEELDRTLMALRNLVDYIQTHPEAVVLGKPGEKEKR